MVGGERRAVFADDNKPQKKPFDFNKFIVTIQAIESTGSPCRR
jgi:hypothetical protein